VIIPEVRMPAIYAFKDNLYFSTKFNIRIVIFGALIAIPFGILSSINHSIIFPNNFTCDNAKYTSPSKILRSMISSLKFKVAVSLLIRIISTEFTP